MATALAFKTKVRSTKYKKARYAIGNVSEKDKIEKLPYEKKMPKHEPNESYFHLAREIAKCMMRSDKLNWYDHSGYTKMAAPYSNVIVTNESKLKRSIINEKLSQKCSAKENELCFPKEDESECANVKQKDEKNEDAYDVKNYLNVSNVFECGRNVKIVRHIACNLILCIFLFLIRAF